MRVAIVDDEEAERTKLKTYVSKYFKNRDAALECVEFASCIDFVTDYADPFDIILLDIEMPHMDGMTAAHKIREKDSRAVIIFVTNMVQYAVSGYEVGALDFMVKPVTEFNLGVKLDRAIKVLPNKHMITLNSVKDGTVVVPIDDIAYIEGANQYVIYHIAGGRTLRLYSSLKAEASKLGRGFSRPGNSFIVNLGHVTKIVGNDVYIGTECLPISRSRKKEFVEEVNRFLGGL